MEAQKSKCKGANRPAAYAKVVYESIEYGVSSIGRGTISGGGWQPRVAGGRKILNSRRDRGIHFQVTDTGNGSSGAGSSGTKCWHPGSGG
jgi:hypothetical protein